MALTKAGVISEIAFRNIYHKDKATEVTETLLEAIKHTLESGEDVMISGFGKFAVREKNGRRGRNPATGEVMMLRPRRIVAFYPSYVLRKKLNGATLDWRYKQ